MRITAIREFPVGLHVDPSGGPANSVANFCNHTVSLIAVLTDGWSSRSKGNGALGNQGDPAV